MHAWKKNLWKKEKREGRECGSNESTWIKEVLRMQQNLQNIRKTHWKFMARGRHFFSCLRINRSFQQSILQIGSWLLQVHRGFQLLLPALLITKLAIHTSSMSLNFSLEYEGVRSNGLKVCSCLTQYWGLHLSTGVIFMGFLHWCAHCFLNIQTLHFIDDVIGILRPGWWKCLGWLSQWVFVGTGGQCF